MKIRSMIFPDYRDFAEMTRVIRVTNDQKFRTLRIFFGETKQPEWKPKTSRERIVGRIADP